MAAIQNFEPVTLVAGNSVSWNRSLSDYKASEGWALKYAFVLAAGGETRIDIEAEADGDDHLVELSGEDTSDYTAGLYDVFGYVEKDSDRYQVYSGRIEVKPDPVVTGTKTDARTFAEKALEAVEASLMGILRAEFENMSVGSKTIGRMSGAEKLQLRDKLKAEIAREKNSKRGGIRPIQFYTV